MIVYTSQARKFKISNLTDVFVPSPPLLAVASQPGAVSCKHLKIVLSEYYRAPVLQGTPCEQILI